jgi:hypothetical protein
MELLGDVDHVESRFGMFGDSVSVSARQVHSLRQMYYLVTRLKWKLISVCLEIVLILKQDSCSVCADRTIGSEIILDAPDGTPR